MSDFDCWHTPSLTSHPIMGHKRRPPRRIKQPGRTGVLVTRTRPNSRAHVQQKAGVCQELAAPFGFRLTQRRRAHLRLAAIPPQSHQSSRVSQPTISRSVPARKCAEGRVEGFGRVGQTLDGVVIVSATPNRLPKSQKGHCRPGALGRPVVPGLQPSRALLTNKSGRAACGLIPSTTNGRHTPIQDTQRRHLGKHEKGAHGRLGASEARPCRIATGRDRASIYGAAERYRLNAGESPALPSCLVSIAGDAPGLYPEEWGSIPQRGSASDGGDCPVSANLCTVIAGSVRSVPAAHRAALRAGDRAPMIVEVPRPGDAGPLATFLATAARLDDVPCRLETTACPSGTRLCYTSRAGAGPARCPSSSLPGDTKHPGRATSVCWEAR